MPSAPASRHSGRVHPACCSMPDSARLVRVAGTSRAEGIDRATGCPHVGAGQPRARPERRPHRSATRGSRGARPRTGPPTTGAPERTVHSRTDQRPHIPAAPAAVGRPGASGATNYRHAHRRESARHQRPHAGSPSSPTLAPDSRPQGQHHQLPAACCRAGLDAGSTLTRAGAGGVGQAGWDLRHRGLPAR